ncbi:MAG: hypothetical protein KBS59_01255, partial [Clostridiales bacterium]|nr:hypothetical protein [Clostridiales bacterium]
TLTVESDIASASDKLPADKYYLLACFDLKLDENGCIESYKRIDISEKADNMKLFAYVKYAVPSTWYNGQTYVDTMSKKAISDFVDITHNRYKECIGEEFGKVVPAIFSDEPQMTQKTPLNSPFDKGGCEFPYTTDLDETFKAAYGFSIVDKLPEIVYDLPDGAVSRPRYLYHEHTSERFAAGFFDTIGEWCQK